MRIIQHMKLITILAVLLWSSLATAQSVVVPAPWQPMGNTVNLTAATTGNDRVQVFSGGSPLPTTAKVCNTGTVSAFVLMGPSTVTVTTSTGTLVAGGVCIPLAIGSTQNQYLAGITASSTTLSIQPGTGTIVAGTPGAGGGPFVTSKLVTSTYDLTTASGTQTITGFGFTPSACILSGAVGGSVFGVTTTYIGLSDAALGQQSLGGFTGSTFTDSHAYLVAVDGSNYQAGSVSAYNSGSITITWIKVGSPTGTFSEIVLCFR